MAIRIEHQPAGAAVMAAYAAGQGKGRARKQKYALDLWKDERREKSKYRMAGRIRQQKLGQQKAGTWYDPMASGATPAGKVELKAKRRANARHRRMHGDDNVPHREAEPTFIPAPTKEEVRREDDQRKRDQYLGDERREREQELEDERRRNTRQGISKRVDGLGMIPDDIADEETRRESRTQANAIRSMARSGDFDLNREETRDDLNEMIDKYNETIANARRFDVGEEYNRSLRYRDPETGRVHEEYAPGRTPVHMEDGQAVDIPLGPAAEAEAAAAEKAEEAAQKRQEAIEREADKIYAVKDEYGKYTITDEQGKKREGTLEDALAQAEKNRGIRDKHFTKPSEGTPRVGVGAGGKRVEIPPEESAVSEDWIKNWDRKEGPLTAPKESVAEQPNRKISPDGKWEWDGTKWISVGGA